MKKILIRSILLTICLLLMVSFCACSRQNEEDSNDLKLTTLHDMTPEEAEAFLGEPVTKSDANDFWYYKDRFTFYGFKIIDLSYCLEDHTVRMIFSNDDDDQVIAKLTELCTVETDKLFDVVISTTYYYDAITIKEMSRIFTFHFN